MISSNLPPVVSRPSVFQVQGGGEDGSYESMTADNVSIQLEHTPSYINVGGLLIEGNGKYNARGNFQGEQVKLEVVPEDQIADVGGMHVQTGTVYHVDGQVGAHTVRGDIREEHKVESAGGINFETDSWKVFEGPEVHLEIHNDRIQGTDHGQPVDGRIEGMMDTERLSISGQVPQATVAEVVSLRPFLIS